MTDRAAERHLQALRRLVWLILGIVIIIDCLITHPTQRIQWIVALVLLGMIPIDEFIARWPRRDR